MLHRRLKGNHVSGMLSLIDFKYRYASLQMVLLWTGVDAMYRIKPKELYILSCEKGRGRRLRPFSQLRM